MTLQEIIADIHALHEDLEVYERKYGVLSETFYELYQSGEKKEPGDTWAPLFIYSDLVNLFLGRP